MKKYLPKLTNLPSKIKLPVAFTPGSKSSSSSAAKSGTSPEPSPTKTAQVQSPKQAGQPLASVTIKSASSLDDFSLTRLISHRVFNNSQQVILVIRLKSNQLFVVTKPAYNVHVIQSDYSGSFSILHSLPLSSLTLISSVSASRFLLKFVNDFEISLDTLTEEEAHVISICLPRLCRAFSSGDPLLMLSTFKSSSSINLSVRCPVLVEYETQNNVVSLIATGSSTSSSPLMSSSLQEALDEINLVQNNEALNAVDNQSFITNSLRTWEINPASDPIALLAQTLENINISLSSLEEHICNTAVLPKKNLQPIQAKNQFNSQLILKLSTLKSVVENILVDISVDEFIGDLFALQTQVETPNKFDPRNSPFCEFVQYITRINSLQDHLLRGPECLATREGLDELKPLVNRFSLVMTTHFIGRMEFYYGFGMVEQGHVLLMNYQDLFNKIKHVMLNSELTRVVSKRLNGCPSLDAWIEALKQEWKFVCLMFGRPSCEQVFKNIVFVKEEQKWGLEEMAVSLAKISRVEWGEDELGEWFDAKFGKQLRDKLDMLISKKREEIKRDWNLFDKMKNGLKDAGVYRGVVLRGIYYSSVNDEKDGLEEDELIRSFAWLGLLEGDEIVAQRFAKKLEEFCQKQIREKEPFSGLFKEPKSEFVFKMFENNNTQDDQHVFDWILKFDSRELRKRVVERIAELTADAYWKLMLWTAENSGLVAGNLKVDEVRALVRGWGKNCF